MQLGRVMLLGCRRQVYLTSICRLPVPQNAPPPLARLLRACWQEDPAARPGFKDILSVLKVLPAGQPLSSYIAMAAFCSFSLIL